MKKPPVSLVRPLIEMAFKEDLGTGDVTSELFFDENQTASADIVSREDIILSGLDIAEEVLCHYDEKLTLKKSAADGEKISAGGRIATIEGPLRPMLSAERIVLNFLQRMSGIATTTSRYVEAVSGTKAKIYDTRKTTPGWRLLEKYAVRCGGGYNHRIGLYDGVLIKDNHLARLKNDLHNELAAVIQKAKTYSEVQFVAVEVDHIEQLKQVLKIPGVDIILLDNMNYTQLRQAVEMRNEICQTPGKPSLEASGNVTLENVAAVANCGVDRIAIGAITHSAKAVDIGLDR